MMDNLQDYKDYKVYNYLENNTLIGNNEQMKSYLESVLSGSGSGSSSVTEKIDSMQASIESTIESTLESTKSEIISAIPCTCNLATKEDVKRYAKIAVNKVNKHTSEVFEDLNAQVKEWLGTASSGDEESNSEVEDETEDDEIVDDDDFEEDING